MKLIKPQKLKAGDTIGIIALSGVIRDKSSIERGKKILEDRGYKVVLSEHLCDENRYLAGTDEQKAAELYKFFKSPEINAIICLRGGYGAIRLADMIDYENIKQNPKIFCGYSDVSALSALFLKRSALMTYSGPMFQGDFGLEKVSEFTMNEFFKTVTSDRLEFEGTHIIREGNAEGILWGGNLATVASLCGLDFIPDEKFIFFTEELNEPVYKIDRYINQLLNIKEFRKNISGIVLGDFLNIDNPQWLDELFIEISEKLQIPVVGGFKITHEHDKITLPYGADAKISQNILSVEY